MKHDRSLHRPKCIWNRVPKTIVTYGQYKKKIHNHIANNEGAIIPRHWTKPLAEMRKYVKTFTY